MVKCSDEATDFTQHGELRDLALPLSHHVGSNADVFPCIALLGVGDHQLATANLKEGTKDICTAVLAQDLIIHLSIVLVSYLIMHNNMAKMYGFFVIKYASQLKFPPECDYLTTLSHPHIITSLVLIFHFEVYIFMHLMAE